VQGLERQGQGATTRRGLDAGIGCVEAGQRRALGAGDLSALRPILACVSPTVLRVRGYRFYFFSREEPRAHVHVQHATGEAKFWLEPRLELAENYRLSPRRVNTALRTIQEHEGEILAAWRKHFGR